MLVAGNAAMRDIDKMLAVKELTFWKGGMGSGADACYVRRHQTCKYHRETESDVMRNPWEIKWKNYPIHNGHRVITI